MMTPFEVTATQIFQSAQFPQKVTALAVNIPGKFGGGEIELALFLGMIGASALLWSACK
jgi:hypothetical protein